MLWLSVVFHICALQYITVGILQNNVSTMVSEVYILCSDQSHSSSGRVKFVFVAPYDLPFVAKDSNI